MVSFLRASPLRSRILVPEKIVWSISRSSVRMDSFVVSWVLAINIRKQIVRDNALRSHSAAAGVRYAFCRVQKRQLTRNFPVPSGVWRRRRCRLSEASEEFTKYALFVFWKHVHQLSAGRHQSCPNVGSYNSCSRSPHYQTDRRIRNLLITIKVVERK